jgi:hypothetical protein
MSSMASAGKPSLLKVNSFPTESYFLSNDINPARENSLTKSKAPIATPPV